MSLSHKLDPKHPQHPDNHPLRAHHPHQVLVHHMTGFFFLFLFFVLGVIGILSNAPFGAVLLSFAPSFVYGLSVLALATSDHLEQKYLYVALFGIIAVFIALFTQLLPQADIFFILMLNVFAMGVFTLLVQQTYISLTPSPTDTVIEYSQEQRDIQGLFSDFIKKAKILNVSIGRVYSSYKGATAGMREKIKVQAELYNQLDAEKRPVVLLDLIKELENRLLLLKQKESNVFTQPELQRIARSGGEVILSLLSRSEGEHISQAYEQAKSYLDSAHKRLTVMSRLQ